MKKNFLWIFILLLAVGCLDDKSKYDYEHINDFGDSFWPHKGCTNIQNNYTLYPGETLFLEPKVRFTIDTVPDASYAWYSGDVDEMKKLADTKDYTYTAEALGIQKLIFSATDNKTGVTFSKKIEISVITSWKNGWLVLSESASGESQISMILSKLQKKVVGDETVDTVVYVGTDMNVIPNLGRGPRKLVENFHYAYYSLNLEIEDEIMLLSDERCVELDGNALQPVGSISDEFLNGVPTNFDPKDAVLSWGGKWLLNSDHYIYSAVMSVATDLHSGRYLSEPAFNNKKVKELLPYAKGHGEKYECASFFLGIGEDNTFFGVRDDGNVARPSNGDFGITAENYIGNYVELSDVAASGVDMSFFKNIDGEYVFHAWAGQGNYYDPLVYLSILRRGGSYYWSYYDVNKEQTTYKPEHKIEITRHTHGQLNAGVMADYQCVTVLPWKNLLVIASGNKLHGFDYYKDETEVAFVNAPTFSSEIVQMAVKDYVLSKYNAHLAVALKSGDVYVYEVAYDVESKQAKLTELYHKEGFGKIVDLIYKAGSLYNATAYSPY